MQDDLPLMPPAPPTPAEAIAAAHADLGDRVIGLALAFRGETMSLRYVPPDGTPRGYLWEASASAEPVDDGPEVCLGRGMTPREAIDACTNEVDDAENDHEREEEDE